MTRHLMLERLTAAEVLPVRVLVPLGHHGLIGLVVQRLQVMQPDQNAHRHAWAARLAVQLPKLLDELLPVHVLGQLYQGMARIQQSLQMYTTRVRERLLTQHRSLHLSQAFGRLYTDSWRFSPWPTTRYCLILPHFCY